LIDWIIRRQNDLATAAPVTPYFFSSLTSSRTGLSSARSRDDNPKSHSFIFAGLWPVTWKTRKPIRYVEILRPPPASVVREVGIYPLRFEAPASN
jgi:hypothetical protein